MALKFIQSGEVAAMVTNPIAKNIINYASKNFTGHTEYLAKKSKSKNFCMMLINDTIRVIPLTIHIPLKKVSQSISKKLIKDTLKIINQSIKKDFGNKKPKILITGLNPHAGENGFLGKEEKDIIKPAINSLKKSMNVYGPISADSAFTKENLNKYDAVLCMYHDQALIPVKTIDFYNTVNYTAGLNFVRTSPDHGTGFDIATKFIANENSLVSAIRDAIKISKNRSINK
jgi:4-hydroxythreonine-4-phosphate dehydrogenase